MKEAPPFRNPSLLPVLIIAVFLLPIACGSYDPSTPLSPNLESQRTIVCLDLAGELSLQKSLSVTKWIEADKGGKIEIKGLLKLKIPKNALSEDTAITVTFPNTKEYLWEFEPDGIQFNKKVKLEISLKDKRLGDDTYDLENIEIYWIDPEVWVPLGAKYVAKKDKIKAELYHFSRYALSDE